MSMTIGFNNVIRNTRWRWGVEGGIMNPGIADYFFEEGEPDRFVHPNFEYVGAVADYNILSKGEAFSFFARGGIAPAHQGDVYLYHREEKFTALGIIGIGADWGFSKLLISGYISPSGITTIQVGYGWWFGKRNKNN